MTHWHEREDYYGVITFVVLCLLVVYSAWLMSWLDGILSDTKKNGDQYKDTHGITRESAQSLKTVAMVLLIITLIFVTTFIWEILSEKYKLHQLIANSKTAILTTGILLAIIVWAQTDMKEVPSSAGGAGPALKTFNTSLIVILSITVAIFAIPMLLATKNAATTMVDNTEDWMFGGSDIDWGGKGRGKSRRRGRNTAPGRLEGN